VKKDEKLTRIEFFKMFMISTRILGGANKFSSKFDVNKRKKCASKDAFLGTKQDIRISLNVPPHPMFGKKKEE